MATGPDLPETEKKGTRSPPRLLKAAKRLRRHQQAKCIDNEYEGFGDATKRNIGILKNIFTIFWDAVKSLCGFFIGIPRSILSFFPKNKTNSWQKSCCAEKNWRLTIALTASILTIIYQLKNPKVYSVALSIFISFIFVSFILSQLDPLQIVSITEKYSKKQINLLTAPFYSMEENGKDARNKIIVVLISDESLSENGKVWPLSYSEHADIIKKIIKSQPRSLFVNVIFETERLSDNTLADARNDIANYISDYKEENKNFILFIAKASYKKSIFSEISGVKETIISWSGYGDDYPLNAFIDTGDNKKPKKCLTDGVCMTAAASLYHHYCRSEQNSCAWKYANISASDNLGTNLKPLTVNWGSWLPVLSIEDFTSDNTLIEDYQSTRDKFAGLYQLINKDAMTGTSNPNDNNENEDNVYIPCHFTRGGYSKSVYQVAKTILINMASLFNISTDEHDNDTEAYRDTCPYHITINESDIEKEGVRELIKDKIVILGTKVEGTGDSIVSPIHGKMPSAYIHAMALDNLITYDEKYPSEKKITKIESIIVYNISAAFMCLIVSLGYHARLARHHLMITAASYLFSVTISIIVFTYNEVHVLNWIGLFGVLEIARISVRKNTGGS